MIFWLIKTKKTTNYKTKQKLGPLLHKLILGDLSIVYLWIDF